MLHSTGEVDCYYWWEQERSLFFLTLIVVNLEVTELVGGLVGGDNSEIFTHLLLLEVLLGQVLEVSLGEVDVGGDDDVVLVLANGDGAAEVTKLSVNLDSLGEEICEIIEDDDVILDGKGAVDGELVHGLLGLASLSSFLLDSFGHCE